MAEGNVVRFTARALDSLRNLVSGLGTSVDKGTTTTWVLNVLTDDALLSAYRGDWMARKIVDIPAEDATREWREWQADAQQITAIEAEEARLNLRGKTFEALSYSRLFGGGALVLGVRGQRPEEELRVDSVGRGALEYVHAVSRRELSAGTLVPDLLSPYYGEPESYDVSSSDFGTARVHPSRVVRFLGARVPDPRMQTGGWGDSVLQVVNDALVQAGTTLAGVAALVQEAKVDVIKIPGLLEHVSNKEYESKLLTRLTTANTVKGIFNTLILDGAEEWERINQDFAALPDIVRVALLVVSAAADIPATRMLGQSPAGLSSTGESDTRNYYDKVAVQQDMHVRPALARLDEVLLRSAIGARPPEVHYQWAPLWQMSETEEAEVALKRAQVYEKDALYGAVPPDALARARQNQLVEDGTYPGLEVILQEERDLDEGDEEVRDQFDRRRRAADARPRTLYVYRRVLNADAIRAWARSQGFASALPAGDMHVTVMYSRTPVDWMRVGAGYPGGSDDGRLRVAPGGPRVVEFWPARDGSDVAVLLFSSTELQWRHQDMRNAGCSYDHDEYQPHVTITYEPGDARVIEPYRGEVVLGPEVFEEVDESHADRLREEAT